MVYHEQNNNNVQWVGEILFILLNVKKKETKKIIIAIAVLFVVAAGFYIVFATPKEVGVSDTAPVTTTTTIGAQETTPPAETPVTTTTTVSMKEFTMNSWMDTIAGKMAAHFSMKEMVVKKGDKVRIKITNTAGDHDFVIDAYGIKTETPLNKETIVEFTADKVGTFEYYCSKYSHRLIGQTGTLRVTE